MTFIIDKIKSLSEIIIKIEEKLGYKRYLKYVYSILIILGIFNFSNIIEYIMDIQTKISKQKHEEKLILRDGFLSELNPLLVEFRSSVGASRVLYFEYHNSTENFVGIPFKFANLVMANQDYECPGYNPNRYKDINSGLISKLYLDLKKKKVIINKGEKFDMNFYKMYPGIHDFFSIQDSSHQQMFINVPGISTPVGMIVLEWVDDEITSDKQWESIKNYVLHELPRINALIAKYTP